MSKRLLLLCLPLVACVPDEWYPEGELVGTCADGLDNDGDGLVDCEDSGCDDRVGCVDAPLYVEGEYVEIEPTDAVDPFDPDCDNPVAWPGDVVLTTPEELADFCRGGNAVEGDLLVAPEPGEGLESLSCLCAVGGRLTIEAPSADGLVWGELRTVGSLALQALATGAFVRFDSLEEAGELAVLADAGRIEFPSLETVDGAFQILSSSIEGVEADALQEAGAFVLQDVPELGFPDFGSLYEVTGPVLIENTGLLHVRSLESLEFVEGDLAIRNNDTLQYLSGFGSLQEVGGDLLITGNPLLSADEIADETDGVDVGGERIIGSNGGDL